MLELNEAARANKKTIVLVCDSTKNIKLLKNTIKNMIDNAPSDVWYNFHIFENKFQRKMKQDIYNLVYGLDRHDILFRDTDKKMLNEIIKDNSKLNPLMEKCANSFEYKNF